MIDAMMLLATQDLIQRAAVEREKAAALQRLAPVESEPEPLPDGTHRAPLPEGLGGISFDPRELILALFEQETADKLLNQVVRAAEHELMSSGMTLLCQASPTLCNTIKHVRANANAMMQTIQQQLAALESRLPGITRIIKAELIQGCFEEKFKKGVPVPIAIKSCLNSRKLKSVAGKLLEELDLASEISALFKLPPEDQEFLSRILRKVKITPDGIEVEMARPSVEKVYWQLREKYFDRWRRLFEGLKEGRVNELFVDGRKTPVLECHQVSRIAALPDWLRIRIVGTACSALAHHELKQRAARIDSLLQSTARAPGASEGIRRAAETEREEIQRELKKLDEENERNLKLQEALLSMSDEADRHVARTMRERLGELKLRAQGEELQREGLPWGECCSKEAKR